MFRMSLACLTWLLLLSFSGCASHHGGHSDPPPPQMLGSSIDAINMTQEINAEASKFVVYAHEFENNDPSNAGIQSSWQLNEYGQDHVKQIAANLHRGCMFPVVVERSQTAVDPRSEYQFPVHFDPNLDAQRRKTVVASLEMLGIADAEQRVVIAPAFAEGISATEGARAYSRGLSVSPGGGGVGSRFFGGFGFRGFGF